MNILIHTIASPYGNQRVGGAETSLKLLAEKLAERGHNVYFFAKEDIKSFKGYTYKIHNGVHIYTYTRLLLPDYNKVRRMGYMIHNLLLKSILREKKIQVVHTYYNLSLCQRLLSFKKNQNFKFIIRVAGMRWAEEIEKHPKLKEPYLKIFNQADSLNFISSGLEKLFDEKWGQFDTAPQVNHRKTLDIGTDINSLPSLELKPNEEKVFKIAMISRLSKYQKRQDILVKAMALIDAQLPIKLTLVGTGDNEEHLRKLIDQLDLSSRVFIEPFLLQDQLWDYMSQLNLLCHACDYEGLSKIIIESMGMGLPVLASDVLPLNTYIIDGENGFLAVNEVATWANKIVEIYQNRNTLKDISTQSSLFIRANYSADVNVKLYENYFKSNI